MTTITFPTAGSHWSTGISAPAVTYNNGNYPLNTTARWQWTVGGTESGSNAGSDLTLTAIADDGKTVVSKALTITRSTGAVGFASSANFSANGSVATALSSVGPTGSHTTVQEWLTITDNAGTVRYIPCF